MQKAALRLTTCAEEAVHNTDLSIICVGTLAILKRSFEPFLHFQNCRTNRKGVKNKGQLSHRSYPQHRCTGHSNVRYGDIIEEFSGKKRGVHFSVVSKPRVLYAKVRQYTIIITRQLP